MPVPTSTLPVYIVTVPSLWTARKVSTWSSATGFAAAVCAGAEEARRNDTTRAPVPIRKSRRVVSRIAMSGPLSHQRRGALDGRDDALVRAASAQVRLERLANLGIGRARAPRGEERSGLHHHPVDAISALGGLLLGERALHRMRVLRRAQPFERDDLARADSRDR